MVDWLLGRKGSKGSKGRKCSKGRKGWKGSKGSKGRKFLTDVWVVLGSTLVTHNCLLGN